MTCVFPILIISHNEIPVYKAVQLSKDITYATHKSVYLNKMWVFKEIGTIKNKNKGKL